MKYSTIKNIEEHTKKYKKRIKRKVSYNIIKMSYLQ